MLLHVHLQESTTLTSYFVYRSYSLVFFLEVAYSVLFWVAEFKTVSNPNNTKLEGAGVAGSRKFNTVDESAYNEAHKCSRSSLYNKKKHYCSCSTTLVILYIPLSSFFTDSFAVTACIQTFSDVFLICFYGRMHFTVIQSSGDVNFALCGLHEITRWNRGVSSVSCVFKSPLHTVVAT